MNRQKILIVDDSELNREMLKAILGEEYDYAEEEDGAQAILMLQQDMNIASIASKQIFLISNFVLVFPKDTLFFRCGGSVAAVQCV